MQIIIIKVISQNDNLIWIKILFNQVLFAWNVETLLPCSIPKGYNNFWNKWRTDKRWNSQGQ